MAHPKVLTKVFPLPLHYSQDRWNATVTSRCVLRVEAVPIVAVRDIYTLATGNGMGVNCMCGCDRVLPRLLHLSVHDKETIVRQMD